MVITDLDHIADQVNLTPSIRKGIEFLKQSRGKQLADGRVDIDGDRVYALVQSYESSAGPGDVYEGHRKYIDLQYVADGEESITWAHIDRVTVTTPYVDKDDYWLGTIPSGTGTPTRLAAGQVAVLYPNDAHAPSRAAEKPAPIKKIVVKVAIES